MSGFAGMANARLGAKNIVRDDAYLGAVRVFMDKDQSLPDSVAPLSARGVKAMYVKNGSGGALTKGLGVVMKSGALNQVGGLHSANGRCDGIIDPYLTGTVADGDYFWLIIEGPIDVEVGSGGLTANSVVQTIASGKFANGTAGTNPVGHSGIAEEAGVDGATARVIFNNPFGINK